MKIHHSRRFSESLHRGGRIALLFIALLPITLSLPAQEQPTLAVLPVFSMGVDATRTKIVYDYIIDQVNRTHAFTLVERAAIDKALSEIKFSMKDVVDERTAAKIGKISGARYILIPALYLAEGTFHLSLRVIETDTARIKNTAVKTTDSFKNVEGLTAQAALALLELDTTQAMVSGKGSSEVSKRLWGNTYFSDDRDSGGSSFIETGIAKDGVITLRGRLAPNPKGGCWINGGVDFDEAGVALARKSKGIRFKAAGGNQFFTIEIKSAAVKDYVYHRRVIFLPEKETEIVVPFTGLEQPPWAQKQVAFSRGEIIGIQFSAFSHKFNFAPLKLDVKDITAVPDDEKTALPEKRPLNGAHRLFYDQGEGGTSQVTNSFMESGFSILEGRVTKVYPYGYIGMGIDFDEAAKKNISRAKGISFWIGGDGKEYKIEFLTSNIKDHDYYSVVLKAEKDFRAVTLLFKDLKQQGWGKPASFNKKDITALQVVTVGQPWESVKVYLAEIEYLPE